MIWWINFRFSHLNKVEYKIKADRLRVSISWPSSDEWMLIIDDYQCLRTPVLGSISKRSTTKSITFTMRMAIQWFYWVRYRKGETVSSMLISMEKSSSNTFSSILLNQLACWAEMKLHAYRPGKTEYRFSISQIISSLFSVTSFWMKNQIKPVLKYFRNQSYLQSLKLGPLTIID